MDLAEAFTMPVKWTNTRMAITTRHCGGGDPYGLKYFFEFRKPLGEVIEAFAYHPFVPWQYIARLLAYSP